MKTIVNIVSDEDPTPAYLFIKESYEPGDHLLFISAKEAEADLQHFASLFDIDPSLIHRIILKHEDDYMRYELICRRLVKQLDSDTHYWVNLAGGSRYMAIAVHQCFASRKALFFYVRSRENQIVKSLFNDEIYSNNDVVYAIRHRMSLREYLRICRIENDLDKPEEHLPTQSADYCAHFFAMFTGQMLSNSDFNVIEMLRLHYRGQARVAISYIEHPKNPKRTAIPNLSNFLAHIGFQTQERGVLLKEELDFITGGWFEEYVYHLVKEYLNPQDIAIGLHVKRRGTHHDNELDVAFMLDNQFHVIECKTGVPTEKLFNEIVYKACALRESFLGSQCRSHLFTLRSDFDGELTKIAALMDIDFADRTCITSPERIQQKLLSIAQE